MNLYLKTLLGCLLFVGLVSIEKAVAQQITVSEFNYNADSAFSTGDWIEIWNFGSTPVDFTGWRLDDGELINTYTFPNGLVLAPDERIVYACNPPRFASKHPGLTNVIGDTVFRLNNGGEAIRIFDAASNVVLAFAYEDTTPWQKTPDGHGRTLELLDPNGDLFDAQNWCAGCMYGTPGVASTPCDPDIIISEINYNSPFSPNTGDWVELHNRTASDVDLSGWFFNDSRDTSLFPIPAGTILPAGGYLVVSGNLASFQTVHPTVTNVVGSFDFNLSGDGEVIQLMDPTEFVMYSTAYNDAPPWPIEADGLGRTLEFDDPTGPAEKASNWFAGCLLGSPGRAYDPDCVNGLSTPENAFQFEAWTAGGQLITRVDVALGEVKFELCTLSGSVARSFGPKTGDRTESLGGVPTGIYILRAISDSGISTRKIPVFY